MLNKIKLSLLLKHRHAVNIMSTNIVGNEIFRDVDIFNKYSEV